MSSAAIPPSLEKNRQGENQLDTERRTRSERVDYKALHSGRTVSSSSRKETSPSPSDTDATTSSPATSMSLSAQRSAAREQKLRSDPLVEVHGPVDVTCRRCGTDIKLSTKSTFDPFHWHRHIERCSKRSAKAIKQIREGKVKDRRKRSSLSKPKQKPKPHAGPLMTTSQRSLRPRQRSSDVTPALTPDHEDDARGDALVKQESPPPQSLASSGVLSTPQPETPVQTPQHEQDVAFEDYLLRSRRRLTRDFPPLSLENGQSWSWAQLKEPVWVVASPPDPDGGGELCDDSGVSLNPDLLPPIDSDIIMGT